MSNALKIIIIVLGIVAAAAVIAIALTCVATKLRARAVAEGISEGQKKLVRFSLAYNKYGSRAFAYSILIVGTLTCLFPFLWMLLSSLMTPSEVVSTLELRLLPTAPQWSNYIRAWTAIDIVRGLRNTMIIEIATIPICVFMSAMEAFAFSKMHMKHKNIHLLILLSGLMVPYVSVVLPTYRAFYNLGLVNTFWPLILPTLCGSVAQMFFYIQYQKGIPDGLFESAKMDGASYFRQFLSIMIPMMVPALAAQIVFMFIGNWNDFFAPSLYLTSENVKTLQLKLKSLSDGNRMDLPYVFAGAAITCVPLFAIYLAFQKYFVGGLAISGTGIKG